MIRSDVCGSNDREQRFSAIYHEWFHRLCLFAYRLLGDMSLAEDLVQDCFLRLWNKEGIFDNVTCIRSFLYRCVYNAALNTVKKDRLKKRISIPVTNQSADIEAIIIWSESCSQLYSLIDKLPPAFSSVLSCYYMQQLSNREIAVKLGISEYTVKSRRQRAVGKLRELMRTSVSIGERKARVETPAVY